MAMGYQFRSCENFPTLLERGREVRLSPQKVMLGGKYEPATTRLYYEYDLDYKTYRRYRVQHETVRNMQVRFDGHTYEQVIEVVKFEMYLASDGSHLFAATTDAYCEEVIKRMRSTYQYVRFGERLISITTMNRVSSPQISGGWFRELNIADVNAAALYGAEVTQSNDWERFSEEGTITVLLMNYVHDTANYKVSVSRKGGIVVFNKLTENVRVQLLDTISRGLEPFVITNTKSKK